MADSLPIVFQKLFDLPNLGINPEFIKFGNLTMECDQNLCIREGNQIALMNLKNGMVQRRPIPTDGAIYSANEILALRSGKTVQSYHLTNKTKLATFNLPEADNISFWRWVNDTEVAYVTANAVFHWNATQAGSQPRKVFDRHASLAGCQVINYQVSQDGKWYLCVGIKKGASGFIEGQMQLYSVDKRVSQPLKGHAGAFAQITVQGRRAQVFCFAEMKPGASPKLYVMEVGATGAGFKIQPQDIPFGADAAGDFPVSMQVSSKHDILFMMTKMGYLFLFDLHTGTCLFRKRVSPDPIFATCPHKATNGILGVTAAKGAVLSVSVNERNLVPFVRDTLKKPELALELAGRLGLPGAEKLYLQRFQGLIQQGNIQGAAQVAATSPGGMLRTPDTIKTFQSLPVQPGQTQPLLQYFQVLLANGPLNKFESLELVRPAIQKRATGLIENWLKEKKLEASEELGDMLVGLELKLALQVFRDARAHDKVVQTLNGLGHYDKAMQYSTQVGYTPNYPDMLRKMLQTQQPDAPRQAMEMAVQLAKNPNVTLDINQTVSIFTDFNMLEQATGFLLKVLDGDKPSDAVLQTKLLEMNLTAGHTKVADAILDRDCFHHFDKTLVANLCERRGLFQRSLDLYTNIEDIKRVLTNFNPNPRFQQNLNAQWLVKYLGERLPREDALECLKQLLQVHPQNLQLVVNVAKEYSDSLHPESLIALFDEIQSTMGLFHYLGAIVNTSTDPEVHFKYIEAASNLGKQSHNPTYFAEVERVCKDSTSYDPERVKNFLLEAKLPEPRPLIHVCDRHNFVEELTEYMYPEMMKYIVVYVQKVSPQKTPKVVGKLLDLDCETETIQNLLNSVRSMCPVEPLVEEVEKRNKLRILEPWLEQRVREGSTEPATHNAVGKIYVTLNRNAEDWLQTNRFYESPVLGQFCEKLDPYLAFLCYKRANGPCDADLIRVTNANSLFKDQARYLVERQDMELWATVLTEENEHKKELVAEVVGTALPDAKDPDKVSSTVKAFMNANLPHELIGLLERLVLQKSIFSENANLQNLLLVTAIRAAPDRVKDFIHRLDKFDGMEIAAIALQEENQLYEEAFLIYKKFEKHLEAVSVLLQRLHDIERAKEFAERVQEPAVWSQLASAQLNEGLIADSIASYITANDATNFRAVIEAANGAECYDDLVKFLTMARESMKEPLIDTEIIYALARCNRLGDLEEFISQPNVARIQVCGDRLFEDEKYESAKLLFANIGNNQRLASCHIALSEFKEAVDAAKKANSIFTWKEVNKACVLNKEFNLARISGLNIIIKADHLDELILTYEEFGYYEELIVLLEEGILLEEPDAHKGIFSALAIMYSKHRPEALMEHVKNHAKRLQVPKVLASCAAGRHWAEAVFLHRFVEDHDEAVKDMVHHSPTCFDLELLLDSAPKVRNQELHYTAIGFFYDEQPMELGKLLKVLTADLDASRVVHLMQRRKDGIGLVMPYLKSVQNKNVATVNEAINAFHVQEEEHEALSESINKYDAFDALDLAQQIEKHELLAFRRIAAKIYENSKRFVQSLELSKKNGMFKDAIDTASASGDAKLANELLRFFVEESDKESFCACLYTCYDLIEPSVALEVAWRNGIMDFAMPFMIQYVHDAHKNMQEVLKRTEPPKNDTKGAFEEEAGLGFGDGPMAIASTAYNPGMGGPNMGQMGGMGGQMGGMGGQMGGMGGQMGGMGPMGDMGGQMGGMGPMGGMGGQMGGQMGANMGGMGPMGGMGGQMGGNMGGMGGF